VQAGAGFKDRPGWGFAQAEATSQGMKLAYPYALRNE
jgi:hypothetical protein